MSCVSRVANVSGLSILVFSSVFSNIYLFVFVLCLVCRGLPMSLDCPFLFASSVFSNVYLFVFVLCLMYRGLPMSLDCPFLVAPRFSLTFICLSSSCFLCAEGCQCLWIVHSCFPLGFLSRLFVCLRPVSCVPMVANVSGLFILDCFLGFL